MSDPTYGHDGPNDSEILHPIRQAYASAANNYHDVSDWDDDEWESIEQAFSAAQASIAEVATELDELRNEVMALQSDGTGYAHGYQRASDFLSVRVNERIRERDDARAQLTDQSALLDEMTAALTGLMRRRLPNGDPCWCSDVEIEAHYPAHGYWCARARAILGRQQPGGE